MIDMIRYNAIVQIATYLAKEFNHEAYRYYRMFGISRWTSFKAAISYDLLSDREIYKMAETFSKRKDVLILIAQEKLKEIQRSVED